MNQWGQSVQTVNQSLGIAVDAMGDLITCFKRDIDGQNRVPKKTQLQVNNSLVELSDSLQQLASSVSGIADAHSRAVLTLLGGNKLNREEFYILLATECVEWTNKTVGLSDFDDYELFDLLRYEAEGQSGYIYLAQDIDDLPDVEPDDWALQFMSRTYRKAIIAPEAIQWSTLSKEQRSFFEQYLPDTVGRFIHEKKTVVRKEPESNDPDNHATLLSGSMTQVDMKELVSALKALKVHMKARRKLDLLIRKGDRSGELVLELSGRSKYSGILTTINCVGGWMTETLVPVGSFRGFIAHPPDDKTLHMSVDDGRLHIGTWNCPARAAKVG